MINHDGILKQHLSEQIALEENLCKIIEEQITGIDDQEFSDAKDLLINARQVLEHHFKPLNDLLEKLEQATLTANKKALLENGAGLKQSLLHEHKSGQLSRILRDDYSALNLITMSNTLLHTIALALNSHEIAKTALNHLENLTPIVVKIGKLMPEIIARELQAESKSIDISIAQVALNNTRLAWRKAM